MPKSDQRPASESARWDGDLAWLDHVTLTDDDLGWLAEARALVLWNVKFPEGFLSRLPHLEGLDYRGGSGTSADFIENCASLRTLSINQVRGLSDLSSVGRANGLRMLSLYGLPKVLRAPSLADLARLDRLELGSMKGLESITEFLEAPALRELYFRKMVNTTLEDADAIAQHPSIEKFGWFAEDVPDRIFVPFFERVGKPRADAVWTDPGTL